MMMRKKSFWTVLVLCVLLSGGAAMACGGGDGEGSNTTVDGMAAGGGWSQFDPAATEGIIGADGQLQTVDQNYRQGIEQQQAEQTYKTKKWLEEGKYYEKMEKGGKIVQVVVNVAGTIVNIISGGTTSTVNSIGQHTANAIESGMESYNQGKSATEVFNDAMVGAGKKAAHIDKMEKAANFISNLKNSSPNIQPPPPIQPATENPDGSFGAGGPALDHDSNFLM